MNHEHREDKQPDENGIQSRLSPEGEQEPDVDPTARPIGKNALAAYILLAPDITMGNMSREAGVDAALDATFPGHTNEPKLNLPGTQEHAREARGYTEEESDTIRNTLG